MFAPALVFLVAVSSALAERRLSISISGSPSFVNAQLAVVTTTLVNTGDEELMLVNTPNSVLTDVPTDKFVVANEQGRSAPFVGMCVDYAPEEVTSFTTIAPGKSVSIVHNLGNAYDFGASGPGKYSIEPASSALLVLTDKGTEEIFAEISTNHIARVNDGIGGRSFIQESFSVLEDDEDENEDEADEAYAEDYNDYDRDGDLFDEDSIENSDKDLAHAQPKFYGCSASQQMVIKSAIPTAHRYARDAHLYLRNHKTSTARYREWFGMFSLRNRKTLRSNFRKIRKHSFSAASYNCTCNENDTRAYVYKNQYAMTWICPAFWRMPATGASNRAGTLVHEASHWKKTADTTDLAYGQENCRKWARASPANAIFGADNHRFFAENIPYLP